MSHDFVDPYLDPETGVLRNLVGAKTYEDLNRAEAEFVASRTGRFLEGALFSPSGSLEDLCCIHKVLFQDIYDWAGQVRTIEIRKNMEGSEFFLPSVNIVTGIAWSQAELQKDHLLMGFDRPEFIERLSYHYDNYNFVHPFREGNGRTQRLLWTLICHNAGFDLDWRLVSGEENDEASRLAAEELDYSGLISMFSRIVAPCDPKVPLNKDLVDPGHLRESI